MKYESLIFDIDGTLWNSPALVAEGYNLQLKKEGLDHLCVNEQILLNLFGRVMTAIADAIFPEIPLPQRYELMDRCIESGNQVLRESTRQIGYPKVKETMAELAKKHRIFIVTNADRGYPELCMEKLGLEDYVSGHLCFGDTGTSKGKTILALMEKHGIKDVVYIGDTQGDYEATVEAGIPFIWCTYGFGTPEHYDAKVDSFEQLLTL